jgi:ankyrin repeat protein
MATDASMDPATERTVIRAMTPAYGAGTGEHSGIRILRQLLESHSGEIFNQRMVSKRMSPLELAVSSKDADMVRFMLEAGAAVNGPASLLVTAVEKRAPDLLPLLLQFGANINGDTVGFTAVTLSAAMECFEPLAFLCDCGANVNKPTERNTTPLMMAAKSVDSQMVDKLLACGADVNAYNVESATALFYAAMSGSYAACKSLLCAGADATVVCLVPGEGNRFLPALHEFQPEAEESIVVLVLAAGAFSFR